MSDEAASKRQWTIKGVSRADAALVIEAAASRGLTVGQWLGYAVRALPAYERGEQIMPLQAAGEAIETYRREIGDTMNDAQGWADAAGLALPKDLTRHALALLRQRLRAARGLPPLRPRQRRTVDAIALASPVRDTQAGATKAMDHRQIELIEAAH